jgi:gamma-glutamylcysteine synthetase
MPRIDRGKLTCPQLAAYFRAAFRPRSGWLVGIEVEKMGVDRATGRPIPYEGASASVRAAVEAYREARGGAFVYEGDRPVGIDAPWGGISLEPGGQFEWSARPAKDLDALDDDLRSTSTRSLRSVPLRGFAGSTSRCSPSPRDRRCRGCRRRATGSCATSSGSGARSRTG